MTGEMMEKICREALDEYGEFSQQLKAIEELSELQRALVRDIAGDGEDAERNVCEEIADVEIMLVQLRHIFDKDEIEDWKDSKLERLARMVGIETGEVDE